mgnify:CR=1 FL=1
MQLSGVQVVFQGSSALTLDAKGRISIPTRHRDALMSQAEGRLTLTRHPDGCLLVYPRSEWEKKREQIAAFPMTARALQRLLLGNAQDVELDGSGPARLDPPSLSEWPEVHWAPDYNKSKQVDLNTLTKEEVASWKPGQTLLLSGKMLTGRDAAHKRIQDMLAKGEPLPVDFTNRVIYYVGPVDPVGDEVVGPAGPTTATRMDKFTDMMLEKTGLISMIGKSERGPVAIEAIKKHGSAYLMAVGGAAYLVSKAIRGAKVLGFADLGMEAIYEFDVKDMPVTVAVDAQGTSVHTTGPKEWQAKIGKIPVAVA